MTDRLSQKSYDELKEKLKHMKTVKRAEIRKAIAEAREHGDLRENSAFHAAKKDQSLNETRIAELEERLHNAEIIDDLKTPKDKVVLGATIRLRDLESKNEVKYTVVSELEADILENKISDSSPVGSAILGCKVNDIVEVEASRGIVKYKILEIL